MKKLSLLCVLLLFSLISFAGYVECGCSQTHSSAGFLPATYVYTYSYLSDANGDCCSNDVYGLASYTVSRQSGGIDRTITETYSDIESAQAACC